MVSKTKLSVVYPGSIDVKVVCEVHKDYEHKRLRAKLFVTH